MVYSITTTAIKGALSYLHLITLSGIQGVRPSFIEAYFTICESLYCESPVNKTQLLRDNLVKSSFKNLSSFSLKASPVLLLWCTAKRLCMLYSIKKSLDTIYCVKICTKQEKIGYCNISKCNLRKEIYYKAHTG